MALIILPCFPVWFLAFWKSLALLNWVEVLFRTVNAKNHSGKKPSLVGYLLYHITMIRCCLSLSKKAMYVGLSILIKKNEQFELQILSCPHQVFQD